MTENTTETKVEEYSAARVAELMALLDPGAAKYAMDQFEQLVQMIATGNDLQTQVKAADKVDPTDTDWLTARAKEVYDLGKDKQMKAAYSKYIQACEVMNKAEDEIWSLVKEHHMPKTLSDAEKAAKRKQYNETKSEVEKASIALQGISAFSSSMLKNMAGTEVAEDFMLKGLPELKPLTNTKSTRKNATTEGGAGEGNFTGVAEAKVDGAEACYVRSGRDGTETKIWHFNHIASHINKEVNSAQVPQNTVTALELEEAYYASNNAEFRVRKGMPIEHTFKFVKPIVTVNKSDGTETTEERTFEIFIKRHLVRGEEG